MDFVLDNILTLILFIPTLLAVSTVLSPAPGEGPLEMDYVHWKSDPAGFIDYLMAEL